MQRVTMQSEVSGKLWRDLVIVAGASLLALMLGAATLRRKAR
jgi:ABC-2 type transport system permease protein